MSVRIVCPRCALRYAGVVDPRCGACRGAGVVAAQGQEPLVAARALHGHLILHDPAERRRAALAAGLLAILAGSRGIDVVPTDTAVRSGIGRRAGSLLVHLGLRPKPPPRKRRDPSAKRATWSAPPDDHKTLAELQAEWRREAAERRARMKALELLGEQHADEYAELVERERVMGALDWAE